MNDFTGTSVSELRKMLIDSGKYSEKEAYDIKGKTKLVQAVLELNSEEDDFVSLIQGVEPSVNIAQSEDVVDSIDYNSPKWHDYVMSQFAEDEVDKNNGYPNIYGLRRVAELLLGPIIQSGPTNIAPPQDNNGPGRATCVYTVVFNWGHVGEERAFSAVGGAYPGNTDDMYCIYPEAIAEVRAEARALRKALKLKVAASEEISSAPKTQPTISTTGEWKETDSISPTQIVFIKQKCKELNIDLDKFLNHNNFSYEKIEDVTRGVALEMLALLNKYQTSAKDSIKVPEEIRENK